VLGRRGRHAPLQVAEARAFYGYQIAIENIHSEMYSQLLQTYIRDTTHRNSLFRAVETFPAIRKKAQWAMKWIKSERPFSERLVRLTRTGAPTPS
jgi:ribonucleoside-diphosphate reductase subunit M2